MCLRNFCFPFLDFRFPPIYDLVFLVLSWFVIVVTISAATLEILAYFRNWPKSMIGVFVSSRRKGLPTVVEVNLV